MAYGVKKLLTTLNDVVRKVVLKRNGVAAMFYIIQKMFDVNGNQIDSDNIATVATLSEANTKIENLYEPCRTVGNRCINDDGSWSIFYIDAE